MVSLFFIFLVGLDFKGFVDPNRKCIIFDLYILKEFLILKVNLFVYNDEFYYQINRKDIKKLKLTTNKKVNFNVAKIPSIVLRRLYLNISSNSADFLNETNFITFKALLDFLLVILQDSIKIKDYSIKFNKSKQEGINFQLSIGLSMYKILFYLVKIMIKNRGEYANNAR